jgi:ubiquinone/menaquinone biosynthesis C-methylase UbiE
LTSEEQRPAEFFNVYEDKARADAYAELEFPGTYFLAYRDLPSILAAHIEGKRALDFGCGTGRSTRFLRQLGFDVVGLDVSEAMIGQARARDPQGEYRLVAEGDFRGFEPSTFDLVLSAFTFDNVPTMEKKVVFLRGLRRLLKPRGCIVNLVSTPEIYVNEWASFSTKDYPKNRLARSGEKVRIVMLDVQDRRPVEDIVWTHDDYLEVFRRAGLQLLRTERPLGRSEEPYSWVSETKVAPWAIHVLASHAPGPGFSGRGS